MCAVFAVSGKSQEYLERGALIAVKSLRLTNPYLPIVVIHCNLSRDQERLFDGCTLLSGDVSAYQCSKKFLSERPDVDTSVFLRFSIERLHDYDTVLYLDSDIVVLDDLREIFRLRGELICRPMHQYKLKTQFTNEQLLMKEGVKPDLSAVNAGVMVIDLASWQRNNFSQRVMELADQYGWDAFAYNDQSLINLIGYGSGRMAALPKRYNFMMWPDMIERNHPLRRNKIGLLAPETGEGLAKIVHWTGPLKPWHEKFKHLSGDERDQFCGPCYTQFAV